MNHKLDTDTHVFFYEQEFYVLSNFSAFRVFIWGEDFDTSEHAYHYAKFTDPSIRQHIIDARSAHLAFKIAQEHKKHRHPNWDQIKVDVMFQILCAKVEQHEYVRRKLLETGDRILVEDSWRDDYWGWGPNKDGANQLGHLWMQIREQLKKQKGEDQ